MTLVFSPKDEDSSPTWGGILVSVLMRNCFCSNFKGNFRGLGKVGQTGDLYPLKIEIIKKLLILELIHVLLRALSENWT